MKILMAVDNQMIGNRITAFMKDAGPPSGAEVRVVTVIPSIMAYASVANIPSLLQELRDQARHEALDLVHSVAGKVMGTIPDASVQALVVEGAPAHEILSMAHDWEADLIYVGSRGRKGVSRLILGSVSEEIVSKAHCQTCVVKGCQSAKAQPAKSCIKA